MNAANDLDLATGERQHAAFHELQVLCAKAQCALHRTDPGDGPVQYFTAHAGLLVHHWTLDSAAAFINTQTVKQTV